MIRKDYMRRFSRYMKEDVDENGVDIRDLVTKIIVACGRSKSFAIICLAKIIVRNSDDGRISRRTRNEALKLVNALPPIVAYDYEQPEYEVSKMIPHPSYLDDIWEALT